MKVKIKLQTEFFNLLLTSGIKMLSTSLTQYLKAKVHLKV